MNGGGPCVFMGHLQAVSLLVTSIRLGQRKASAILSVEIFI